jgi:hypothetical protein
MISVEGSDILQTLAELAIALTGFTGIVVAFRGRTDAPLSGYARVRFRILLVASLASTAFALLPFFFHHLRFAPDVTWSICSSVVFLFMIALAVHDIRVARVYSDTMPKLDRQALPLLLLLGTALWLAQIANVLILHAFAPYLAAPMWFVGFAAFQFSQLVLDVDRASIA